MKTIFPGVERQKKVQVGLFIEHAPPACWRRISFKTIHYSWYSVSKMKDARAHQLFKYAMFWRIAYGLFRVITGLILLKFIHRPFSEVFQSLTRLEITAEQANAILFNINSFLETHPVHVTYFVTGYLIFWGTLDIILSIKLLMHKMWAFPLSMYLISIFIFYELFRLFHTHSVILFFVIITDILVLWLIKKEYIKYRIRRGIDAEQPTPQ